MLSWGPEKEIVWMEKGDKARGDVHVRKVGFLGLGEVNWGSTNERTQRRGWEGEGEEEQCVLWGL